MARWCGSVGKEALDADIFVYLVVAGIQEISASCNDDPSSGNRLIGHQSISPWYGGKYTARFLDCESLGMCDTIADKSSEKKSAVVTRIR